jgi:hypothetical protein
VLLVTTVTSALFAGCGAGSGHERTLVTEPNGAPDEPEATAESAPREPSPDAVGPHEVENNRGRQRRELSAPDRRITEEGVLRIRSSLDQLRAQNQLSTEAVATALIGLGYERADIDVRPFSTPPGVVYGLRVGEAGCINGDVRPTRVLVEVAGTSPESGCIEPPVGH